MSNTPNRCPVCNERKRLKVIPTRYKFGRDEPFFCSLRCAAQYGVLAASIGMEGGLQWCPTEGQYESIVEGDACPCGVEHE